MSSKRWGIGFWDWELFFQKALWTEIQSDLKKRWGIKKISGKTKIRFFHAKRGGVPPKLAGDHEIQV